MRNLTDEDVEALVDAFEVRMTKKFYQDLGKGVAGMAWKVVITAILAVAAYGAWKGHI